MSATWWQGPGDHADIGIAYDGDADRVGIIDEGGRRHEADLILALLARDLLTRHPGAPIVFDVKCSQVLIDDILQHGGRPVMWKTGHSHLKRKMREDGILLGGEVSGHMFFGENWYGVDDGILASCKFLELVARERIPVSAHFDTLPHLFATPELKAACPDDKKFAVVTELARELKRGTRRWTSTGCASSFPTAGGWCAPPIPTPTSPSASRRRAGPRSRPCSATCTTPCGAYPR